MKKLRHWSISFLWVLIALQCGGLKATAQKALPVLKAGSGPVDIRDGQHLKKGYWQAMPERKPDDYYAEIPEQPHLVTFITDQDSISFKVTYANTYNFILLRNGRDSCYTRIVAQYKDPQRLLPAGLPAAVPDTLHFNLGANNKLYLDGTLNGSVVRNCQLDLGAGGIVINEHSVPKIAIHFDSKTTLSNSDGVNEVPLSSKNQLKLGNLIWDSIPVIVAKNMRPEEDLIVSNALFINKILAINYDQKHLIISDSLPADISTYTRLDMILDQGILPFIPITLKIKDSVYSGWAMFDTGARITILNSRDASKTYRFFVQLAALFSFQQQPSYISRLTPIPPTIDIGKYPMRGFEYKTRDMGQGPKLSLILGADLLHRFNMVLDNRHGYIYLKPNSYWNTPYQHPDEYYTVRIAVAITVILVLLLLIYWQYKQRRRRRHGNRRGRRRMHTQDKDKH